MAKYKDKFDRLANEPVRPLISKLAVPTIFTMLVSALYNMADSYFVGKIDTVSVASIGIVFSIMTLLQAIGFFLGNGSGIMLSSKLGENKRDEAGFYANTAFFTALGIGIVIAIAGLFLSNQLAALLGATKTTVAFASGYLRIILLGSPFILGSFVLNNHLRYQGSAFYSMLGIVSGSVINIFLDPIFIFKLNLGVRGAAIATIIGQFISFIILLNGTRKNENLEITIKAFRLNTRIYGDIVKNGLPSLARQGVNTVANIAMNFACAPFGDEAIAGMSVYNRVLFLGFAIAIGYGQGYQPVCSFNNGAKRYDRVYNGYKFTAIITSIIMTSFGIIEFIFAPQLIALFRDDVEVIKIGATALRYQCIALPVLGFATSANMLLQSLKISGKATILSLGRQGIFYIPFILLAPKLIGLNAILLAQPVADYLSLLLTIFLSVPEIKELRSSAKHIKQ